MMTDIVERLLPCPFCGEQPARTVLSSGFRKIVCDGCGIEGSQSWWEKRADAQSASEHAAKQIDAVCDYLGKNIDRLSRLLERDDWKSSRAHIEGARNAMASADNTLTQICLSLTSAERSTLANEGQ